MARIIAVMCLIATASASAQISQPAPVITSGNMVAFDGSYIATANSGFGSHEWALGAGSTASGAAIDASTGTVSFTSVGTVVIKARFSGDSNYAPSPNSPDFTITVNKASQAAPTISSATMATLGDVYTATVAPTGDTIPQWALGSGSTASDPAIHAATGYTQFSSVGTVVIKARFPESDNYLASAYSPDFTITVDKATLLLPLGDLEAIYNGTPRSALASVQDLVVTTAIGGPYSWHSTLSNPWDVAFDSSGDLYFADAFANVIGKVSPAGVVTILAGTAGEAGADDGTGSNARFNGPTGIAVSHTGEIYVADQYNQAVRKITPEGAVTTLAGLVGMEGFADGTGSDARFRRPTDVEVDAFGNIFVTDSANSAIRKVTPAGVVTTIAGNATVGSTDGPVNQARFRYPKGLAVDSVGNIYVADQDNSTIRKIDPDGMVSTVAGLALEVGSNDGMAAQARFQYPWDVAVDDFGNLYVSEFSDNTIRLITSVGLVTTVAGAVGSSDAESADGQGTTARFRNPAGLAMAPSGNLYVADGNGQGIRRLTLPSGAISVTYNGGMTPPTDPGAYTMVATLSDDPNYEGSASDTLIIVDNGPVVTSQSPNRNVVVPGDDLTLSVTAVGTSAISYQWFHDNRPIDGATSSTLLLTDATYAHSGAYWVRMTNTAGSTRSAPLFVSVAPAVTQLITWGSLVGGGQPAIPAGLGRVLAISAGGSHSVALKADGTVAGWEGSGQPLYGQMSIPIGLTNVVAVAAGGSHSLALRSDGTVVAWGGNFSGQTNVPTGLSNVVAIAASSAHSLAVKTDGTVVGWGYTVNNVSIPPDGLNNIVAVSGSGDFSLALKADGTVAAWGSPDSNQLFVPSDLNTAVAVDAGTNHSLALTASGNVVAWGSNINGALTIPADLGTVLAVSAGPDYSAAIKANGTMAVWGRSFEGQTAVPAGLADVLAVSAGGRHVVVMRDASSDLPPSVTTQPVSQTRVEAESVTFTVSATGDGALTYQWRRNEIDLPGATSSSLTLEDLALTDAGDYDVVVTNHIASTTSAVATITVNPAPVVTLLSPVRQVVSPGGSLNLAVSATGTGSLSYQWTRNGVAIPGASSETYSLPAATLEHNGYYVVLVTDSFGTRYSAPMFVIVAPAETQIRGWGLNSIPFTTIPARLYDAISVSASGSPLAIKRNGTIVELGGPHYPLMDISGLTDVVAVSAGGGFWLALKSDGTVVAWGYNNSGITQVPAGLNNVVAIAAGIESGGPFALALKHNGTVVGWGNNSSGQINIPSGLANVRALAAGHSHALALKADGTVVQWGQIHSGATPVPADLAGVIAIAAGAYHSLALRDDGTVVAWGQGYQGQTTVPAGLTGVKAIAAGHYHSFALKNDGTIVAWGRNDSGQATPPPELPNVFVISGGTWDSLALRDATGDPLPTIDLHPASQTVAAGSSVVLTGAASAVGQLDYQWQRDGVDLVDGAGISGATGPILTLTNVQTGSSGSYTLAASSAAGTTTASAAVLSVHTPPTITSRPLSRTATVGQAIAFTVAATDPAGPDYPTYQWKRNGMLIPGETGPTLDISSIAPTDKGWYEVIVSNATVSVSSFFRLNVVIPNTSLVAWGLNSDGQLDAPAGLGNVASVAGGLRHGIASLVDGTVVAWGSDYSGGGVNTVPSGLSNVIALATNRQHSLVLRSDGTVTAWGYDDSGSTNVPAGLSNVIAVASGTLHSVALKNDGTVVVWGSNTFGQKSVPAGLSDVVDIACGTGHTLALKKDGTVVAWGNSGLATVPAGLSGVIALSSYGTTNLALKADGAVVEWEATSTTPNSLPAGLANVTAIASGANHRLALKADGTVQAWGIGSSGQTAVPAGLANVAGIGAGSEQSFALVPQVAPVVTVPPQDKIVDAGSLVTLTVTATGRPLRYQWLKNNVELVDGANISGATTPTLLISSAQPTDAGEYTVRVFNDVGSAVSAAAAITINGPAITSRPQSRLATEGESVSFTIGATGTGALSYQWKHDGIVIPGATGATLELANVIATDRGRYEGIVTDATGTNRTVFYLNVALNNAALVAWGRNDAGQTNVPSNPGALASVRADRNYGLAVKADGTVLKWGNHAPSVPSELTDVVDVSSGGGAAFALKADGTVISWGESGTGQRAVPAGLNNVVAIATKAYHSIALKSDGTVATWGFSYGQAPVPADLANVIAVAAADNYYMALKSDGTVVEWGQSQAGGMAKPENLNDVVAIAAGDTYSMALRSTGEVVRWRNTDGFVLLNLSNVTAIATGPGHMLALRGDGTVAAWGSNGYGETTVPADLTNAVAITGGLNFSVALVPATAGLPVITAHSPSQTVSVGQDVVVTVGATGSGLSYQWRRDGAALANGGTISGATSPSLEIVNVQLSDAGSYSVVVRNTAGSVVSSATLGVSLAPVITTRPLSRSALVGEAVTFATTVSGSGLTYQWKRNGQVLAGATGPSLDIASVTLADRGRYEMIVTNGSGLSAQTVFMFHPTSLNSWVKGWGSDTYGQSTVPMGLGPVIGIAASGHSLAIRTDGTVVGWGPNNSGQTSIPAGLNNVVSVKIGGQFSVALKDDGTVSAWGNNGHQQATVPAGLENVVAIDASNSGNSLALRADGTVVSWGVNGSPVFPPPPGLTDVVAIAASDWHSLAVKADGTVVVWGDVSYRPPAGMNEVVDAIWGPSRGLAIKQDGTVQGWSSASTYDQSGIPVGLNQVRALSSKWNHTLALNADGTVVAWGNNADGQTAIPKDLSGVFDIAAGSGYNLVLVSNNLPPLVEVHPHDLTVASGAVASFTIRASGGGPLSYQWQRRPAGNSSWTNLADGGIYSGATTPELVLPVVSSSMSGDQFRCIISNPGGSSTTNAAILTANGIAAFSSASAGASHSLFVRADGTLWGMGSNSSGQLGVATLLGSTAGPTSPVFIATSVAQVAATKGYHSLFIKTDGTLWAMGANSSGQLGDGSQSARSIPVQIATGVLMAAGGSSHTLFLKTDGTLWAMGDNGSGQLGDGTQIQRTNPVQIATGVARISAGGSHSMFVKTDGTMWVMGANGEGQLGTGDQTNRFTPEQVAMGVTRIAAGGAHSFFIKTDGTLWGMGANNSGQLGDGTLVQRTSPAQIATGIVDVWAGGAHSFFLKPNGALWGMGRNFYGTLGNGLGSIWSSPVQVATGALAASGGGDHSLFIGTDGTLRAMGYGSYGALGIGTTNGSSNPVAVTELPPLITLQPVSQTLAGSVPAIFPVRASGRNPLTYQWQLGNGTTWQTIAEGDAFSGRTTDTLTIASWAISALNGIQFRCIVTNSVGSVASNACTLTVRGLISDFDGDGYSDLLWRHLPSRLVVSWTSSFGYRSLGQEDADWQVIGSGDFDGDGYSDLIWRHLPSGLVASWTSSRGYRPLGYENADWQVVATGDFDGDGNSDLIWRHHPSGLLTSWTSSLGYRPLGYEDSDWHVFSAGDYDGDGNSDLLWRHLPSGLVTSWTSSSGYRPLGYEDTNWHVISSGDFDGDGYTDLLWQHAPSGLIASWTSSQGYYHFGFEDVSWQILR